MIQHPLPLALPFAPAAPLAAVRPAREAANAQTLCHHVTP
jgi:hypothetical protein